MKGGIRLSVPASERMLSSAQFVYNAFDLYKLALNVCLSMPKRYTYMIAQPLLDKARKLCDMCVRGNTIFPVVYEQDFMIRRRYLLEAQGIAYSISTDINALLYIKHSIKSGENSPLVSVRDSMLDSFLKIINKEIETLAKIIKSDEKRFEESKSGNKSSSYNKFKPTDKKVISFKHTA